MERYPGRPTRYGNALRGALVHLLFLALAAWLFRLAFEPGFLVFGHDAIGQFFPWRAYAAEEIHAGRFPAWNPYLFSGVPFAANPQVGLFYPPNLLFLFLPAELGLTASAILHLYLGGAFAYHLARSSGLSPVPATVAGLSWGFSGFSAARILAGHATILAAIPWLPLLLLAIDRWAKGGSRRYLVVGAGAGALSFLAGHPQMAHMTALAAAVFVLHRALADRKRFARTLGGALAMALLATLLAAVQILPAARFAKEVARVEAGDEKFLTTVSAPPETAATLFFPRLFGWHDFFYMSVYQPDYLVAEKPPEGPARYWGREGNWEIGCYAGALALFLGLSSLFRRPLPRRELSLLAAAGLCFWLSLGKYGAGYPTIARIVPGLSLFRAPARFLFLADLALAILAGCGVQWALTRERGAPSRAEKSAIGALLLVALALAGLAFATGPDSWPWRAIYVGPAGMPSSHAFATARESALVAAFLAALAAAAVLLGRRLPGRRPRAVLAALLLAAVLGDLAWNFGPAVRAVPLAPLLPGGEIARRLAEREHDRFALENASILGANSLLTRRVRTAGGYDPLLPARYEDLVLAVRGESRKGVSTVLLPSGERPVARALALAGRVDVEGWREEDTDGAPRVYLARRARALADEDALLAISSPGWDPRREAILDSGPGVSIEPEGGDLGTVEFLEDSPGLVRLRVVASARRVLVLADRFDPEWEAKVDGESVTIYRAQVIHRAVIVESGSHEVEFRYRPRLLLAGGIVSGVGCLAAGLLLVWRRPRS